MRLWTLHPRYLDARGLVAVWREGLLAVLPQWSPDGRELFYNGPEGLMVVTVETDPVVKLGTPKSLFRMQYAGLDLNPDGRRFLAIKYPQPTGEQSSDEESAFSMPRKINIVVNWFEELKRLCPTGK